jgi:hypothetical protein
VFRAGAATFTSLRRLRMCVEAQHARAAGMARSCATRRTIGGIAMTDDLHEYGGQAFVAAGRRHESAPGVRRFDRGEADALRAATWAGRRSAPADRVRETR